MLSSKNYEYHPSEKREHTRQVAAALLAAIMGVTPLATPLTAVAAPDEGTSENANQQVHASRTYFANSRGEMRDLVLRYYQALGATQDQLARLDSYYLKEGKGNPLINTYGSIISRLHRSLEQREFKTADGEEIDIDFSFLDSLSELYMELAFDSSYYDSRDDHSDCYRAFEDPSFLRNVDRYAKEAYDAFEKAGILDEKLLDLIGSEEISGEDLLEKYEQYLSGTSGYYINEHMFDGISSIDVNKTYYIIPISIEEDAYIGSVDERDEDWTRAYEEPPTFSNATVTLRDLFDMSGTREAYPYTGFDSGSGRTELSAIAQPPAEYGGTIEKPYIDKDGNPTSEPTDPITGENNKDNPLYNPDEDDDNLGDNLAFTVPSSINFVVKTDGALLPPSKESTYIENRTAMPIHLSSLNVIPEANWNFENLDTLKNIPSTIQSNDVIGLKVNELDLSDFENNKHTIRNQKQWNMAGFDGIIGNGADIVQLQLEGKMANLSQNLSFSKYQKFGEIHWYMTGGSADDQVEIQENSGYALSNSDINDWEIEDLERTKFVESNGTTTYEGKYLMSFSNISDSEIGNLYRLNLSDGTSIEVIIVGVLENQLEECDEAHLYNYDGQNSYVIGNNFDKRVSLGFYTEDAEFSNNFTVRDFSCIGHPGAYAVSYEYLGEFSD